LLRHFFGTGACQVQIADIHPPLIRRYVVVVQTSEKISHTALGHRFSSRRVFGNASLSTPTRSGAIARMP
jgi:hypothetical protein